MNYEKFLFFGVIASITCTGIALIFATVSFIKMYSQAVNQGKTKLLFGKYRIADLSKTERSVQIFLPLIFFGFLSIVFFILIGSLEIK